MSLQPLMQAAVEIRAHAFAAIAALLLADAQFLAQAPSHEAGFGSSAQNAGASTMASGCDLRHFADKSPLGIRHWLSRSRCAISRLMPTIVRSRSARRSSGCDLLRIAGPRCSAIRSGSCPRRISRTGSMMAKSEVSPLLLWPQVKNDEQ